MQINTRTFVNMGYTTSRANSIMTTISKCCKVSLGYTEDTFKTIRQTDIDTAIKGLQDYIINNESLNYNTKRGIRNKMKIITALKSIRWNLNIYNL